MGFGIRVSGLLERDEELRPVGVQARVGHAVAWCWVESLGFGVES